MQSANSKLQILKVDDAFAVDNITSFEDFLHKHNASATDRLRDLHKDITDCFGALRQPASTDRLKHVDPISADKCKQTNARAKRKEPGSSPGVGLSQQWKTLLLHLALKLKTHL